MFHPIPRRYWLDRLLSPTVRVPNNPLLELTLNSEIDKALRRQREMIAAFALVAFAIGPAVIMVGRALLHRACG